MFKHTIRVLALLLILTSSCYAARQNRKKSKNNSVTVRVEAFERNSKTPVYRGPVSIVGFSGTKKGETDANGVFEAVFPGNDTVAVAIKGAVGYRDTTTKSAAIRNKKRTFKVKMRRNNREQPLSPPTPTPKPQPTNKPNSTPTPKPPVVFTPGHPIFPTPMPPLPPAGTPDASKPPVITKQPQSNYITQPGQGVQLSVTATGSGTLSYQWKLDGKLLTTARTSFYTFAAPFSISSGQKIYKLSCVVSNQAGSVESNEAVIYVTANF